ncbi:MAG TPA: hypothetical protein VG101_12930, partial [Puia sp.]|nr:hypothetical protein [Puia sp.]
MLKVFSIGTLIIITFISPARAQRDTLKIDLFHAEKIFLDSNFQLLAQRYNIDVQRALILQAKLWPNPNLSIAQGPIIPI